MRNNKINSNKLNMDQYAPIIGVVLVVSGLLFLLDQRIKTNWLSLALPVLISLILLGTGIYLKKRSLIIPGYICTGISSTFFIIFQNLVPVEKTIILVALGIGIFGLSWLLLFLTLMLVQKEYAWWTLFVSTISTAISYNLFLPDQVFVKYVFAVTLAIGIVFLLWGIKRRKLGLLIPGLLISTIGSGVYFAWNGAIDGNGLQETGTMLVWFALGWILITVVSKIFSRNFVWWPLIPGGVLAMVGSGLYIGGNPDNALGFFQNTGSIGLIMFGVYLILLKYGMKK